MEVVISLLLFLGDPPVLKEHLLMKNFSECLEKKRIAQISWTRGKAKKIEVIMNALKNELTALQR